MATKQSLIDNFFEEDTKNNEFVKYLQKKDEEKKREILQKKLMKKIIMERPKPFSYNDYSYYKKYSEHDALTGDELIEIMVKNMLLIDQKNLK